MTTTHPHAEEIVEAIRSHKTIGRWTCSPIDECYTDVELIEEFGWLANGNPRTVISAVRHAVWHHNLWVERFNEINSL